MGLAIAQITLPSSSSITAGNVTLTASTTGPRSFDPTTLLTDLGLTSATSLLNFDPSTFSPSTLLAFFNPLSFLGSIATVTDQGNITASGNISIVADASNDAGLSKAIGTDELLFHLTEAIATVGGQGATPTLTATGGTVSISTNDHGTRDTTTDTQNVVVSVGIDRSDATIDGATIHAEGLTLNAQSAADYNITAAKALNLIDGDTTAAVTDGAHLNVTTGGAQISASENSTITATSSGQGGLPAALNYVNKSTDAYVAKGTSTGGSSVIATDGAVSVMATGNATINAKSTIAPPDAGGTNPPTTSAYVFAGNITTGGVAAYLIGSSVQATGTTGNVTIEANNTATTDATIDATVEPTDTTTRSFGLGVALNVAGFDATNILAKGVDALLGPTSALGATDTAGTLAYAQDSTLNAGGSVSLTATDNATVSSNLSNTSSTPPSSGEAGSTSSTTRPVSTGAILSFNLLNTNTQAYASYTNPLPHATSPDVEAADGITISANDTATITSTIVLGATMSGGGTSGSQQIAGAVSFNNVIGGASATVSNAAVELSGGALLVSAYEAATITADTKSEGHGQLVERRRVVGGRGGTTDTSSFGGGKSLEPAVSSGWNVARGCDRHHDRQHRHRHGRQRPERDGHG